VQVKSSSEIDSRCVLWRAYYLKDARTKPEVSVVYLKVTVQRNRWNKTLIQQEKNSYLSTVTYLW